MKQPNQKSKISAGGGSASGGKNQNHGANFAQQNLRSIGTRRIAALDDFDICLLHFDFRAKRGFTLIETLVAVSLLVIAIVAPMSLTTQSLSAARYSKEQIAAFHLAQEAIESIRHVRDGNVLRIARGDLSVNLMSPIPETDFDPFIVNTLDDSLRSCLAGGCPPLQINGTSRLYGYRPDCAMPIADCGAGGGWTNSIFTRTVRSRFVAGTNENEMLVEVTVAWNTAGGQSRTFTISEDLYRWVRDSSAI